jgi:hypothetical protein
MTFVQLGGGYTRPITPGEKRVGLYAGQRRSEKHGTLLGDQRPVVLSSSTGNGQVGDELNNCAQHPRAEKEGVPRRRLGE